MGLSPEEEAVFAALAYDLEGGRSGSIPWSTVAVGVAVVSVGVLGAWLSGVPGGVVGMFCLAFASALGTGLLVLALVDRRKRRVARRGRDRRRAADARQPGR